MDHGVVHIDLPEAREPLPDLLVRQDADAEQRLAFDTLVECDLGTGQQADRNVRLPDRRESASNRIVEFRRYQLVFDLGRPVRDVVQTIVTHRRVPLHVKSRDFPDPRTDGKISAFPAHLEEEMPGRHATFSISMEASPLVLYPRKKSWKSGRVGVSGWSCTSPDERRNYGRYQTQRTSRTHGISGSAEYACDCDSGFRRCRGSTSARGGNIARPGF